MKDMNEIQTIQSKIYEIRGQRVMLDRDLAAMYGVETKVLNQAENAMLPALRAMILCSV